MTPMVPMSRRILVVDDDPHIRDLLAFALLAAATIAVLRPNLRRTA